jgi:hypothetical protein
MKSFWNQPVYDLIKSLFRKKPLTWDSEIGGIGVKAFSKENLLRIIKECPDGSRILINRDTWIEVHHGST